MPERKHIVASQEEIQREMEQWTLLRRAMTDDAHYAGHSEPTLRMQQTETLLLASASLRRISRKVRQHAQELRATGTNQRV